MIIVLATINFLGSVAIVVAVIVLSIRSQRRVDRVNTRLSDQYELAKIDARRMGLPPPCPPNRVVLR